MIEYQGISDTSLIPEYSLFCQRGHLLYELSTTANCCETRVLFFCILCAQLRHFSFYSFTFMGDGWLDIHAFCLLPYSHPSFALHRKNNEIRRLSLQYKVYQDQIVHWLEVFA